MAKKYTPGSSMCAQLYLKAQVLQTTYHCSTKNTQTKFSVRTIKYTIKEEEKFYPIQQTWVLNSNNSTFLPENSVSASLNYFTFLKANITCSLDDFVCFESGPIQNIRRTCSTAQSHNLHLSPVVCIRAHHVHTLLCSKKTSEIYRRDGTILAYIDSGSQ